MSHVVSTDSDSLSQPNYQSIIIDKGICGCGFTNYCLTISTATTSSIFVPLTMAMSVPCLPLPSLLATMV